MSNRVEIEVNKANKTLLRKLMPPGHRKMTLSVDEMRTIIISKIRESPICHAEMAEALYSEFGSEDEELYEIWRPGGDFKLRHQSIGFQPTHRIVPGWDGEAFSK
jgi:hypothetical protein